MPAKYYIYAGRRWCEVDTRRGRVVGWRQRARFCFLRGGRLEVARTAPVLRSLRVLATGAGGAARDAAPLPYARPRLRRESVVPAHVCCSHHHSRCDLNANELGEKPPPSLQPAALTSAPVASAPLKRKKSTSDEAPSKAKKAKPGPASKVKQKSPQKSNVRVRGKEEAEIVQSLLQSSSEETGKDQKKPQKSKTGPSKEDKKRLSPKKTVKRGKEEEELVRSLLQSSSDETGNQNKSPQKSGRDLQTEVIQSLLQFPSDKSPKTAPKNDNKKVSSKSQPARSKPADTNTDSSDSSESENKHCKELLIDEDDVDVLRNFLAREAKGVDLERYDKDDEYKVQIFYKLNPLVKLSRCSHMERLLKQKLSLKEFAKYLGLRSVADVTPEKRYRMRHSTRQARSVPSDTETEKENLVQPKRRQLWNKDKAVFNSFRASRSSDIKDKPQIPKPVQESSQDSSDSDTEVKKHIRRNLERRASARLNPGREKNREKEDNESIVVSDESDTEGDRRKSSLTRDRTDKMNESVVVSDDSDENRGKSKSTTTSSESHVVSDDSDSNDKHRRKSIRTRATSQSVMVSDDSSDDNENRGKATRKTRSQGPEKRVLREQNKSVVISDDDSNAGESRAKSKSKAKETARTQSKSVVISDESSTDENQEKHRRTRSRGPDKALKEQNNDNRSKSDNKPKKHVASSNDSIRTRSSIKGADNDSTTKVETSKKNKPVSNKRKENKTEDKEVSKGLKKAVDEDQDKSVISDSDSAFETKKVSPKKQTDKNAKGNSFLSMIKSVKGRFLKKNETVKEKEKKYTKINEKQRAESEKQKDSKSSEKRRIEKESEENAKRRIEIQKNRNNEKHDKGKNEKDSHKSSENNRSGTESEKDKSKKKSAIASMLMKPLKVKKSSAPFGREYTSLEDHAIVAWISVGNRERLVNGNAIWRELQMEYTRLTSQTRSWHSLRNRYLRYILPSLASLALPPAQASRLRAAAAIGKLKGRPGYRRNSIFNAPRVRSAATAGRGRPRSDSEHDKRDRTPPPRRARLASPSNLPSKPPKRGPPSPSKRVFKRIVSPSKSITSSSKSITSPSKSITSPSKSVTSPSKSVTSPSKSVTSPSKRTVPSPRASRLRLRPSAASSPAPKKKKRIHHL